jgi:hypothetical protein
VNPDPAATIMLCEQALGDCIRAWVSLSRSPSLTLEATDGLFFILCQTPPMPAGPIFTGTIAKREIARAGPYLTREQAELCRDYLLDMARRSRFLDP